MFRPPRLYLPDKPEFDKRKRSIIRCSFLLFNQNFNLIVGCALVTDVDLEFTGLYGVGAVGEVEAQGFVADIKGKILFRAC